MIDWSKIKVGDFVKAPGFMNYFLIVDSEDLGVGFPNKFYAVQVFTGSHGVVDYKWKRVGLLNPIKFILYIGCMCLQKPV